jgi:hypothetical protein
MNQNILRDNDQIVDIFMRVFNEYNFEIAFCYSILLHVRKTQGIYNSPIFTDKGLKKKIIDLTGEKNFSFTYENFLNKAIKLGEKHMNDKTPLGEKEHSNIFYRVDQYVMPYTKKIKSSENDRIINTFMQIYDFYGFDFAFFYTIHASDWYSLREYTSPILFDKEIKSKILKLTGRKGYWFTYNNFLRKTAQILEKEIEIEESNNQENNKTIFYYIDEWLRNR